MEGPFAEDLDGEAGDTARLLNTLVSDETDENIQRALKASLLVDAVPMETLKKWRAEIREAESVGPLLNPGSHDFEETERTKLRVEGLIALKEKLDEAEEV